jgi:uncharacterized protein YqjF (DUF2071 family)
MAALFLKAEWRKLIMANYPVDPAALRPLLPARTELDTWAGDVYVSLVGFQFRETRVRGLRIPFHTNFPEVNLRFYIRYKEGGPGKEAWLIPFGKLYGAAFTALENQLPQSVFLAEGSAIEVYGKKNV